MQQSTQMPNSPRGDETVYKSSNTRGVYIVNSAQLKGISDYKQTHLHLHSLYITQSQQFFESNVKYEEKDSKAI